MGRLQVRLSEHRRGHVDKDPALTVDGSGRFWVAWHGYRPKEDRILVRSFRGQERDPLRVMSEEAGINFQPRIACAGDAVWVGVVRCAGGTVVRAGPIGRRDGRGGAAG